MSYENISNLAKSYVLSKYSKSKKPDFDKTIGEVESHLIDNDIYEYNTKKKNAERKIEDLSRTISQINEDFKLEFDRIKRIYKNDVEEQISFISKEKVNYQHMVSGNSSLLENIKNFQSIMKENIDKIKDFCVSINKLNSTLHADSKKTLNQAKSSLSTFFDEEKNRIKGDLQAFYTLTKTNLEAQLIAETEEKRRVLALNENELHNGMEKDGTYIKINLIIWLCLIVGAIDFMIIYLDMALFGGIRKSSDIVERLLYHGVMPFLFSFGIIIGEFINNKVISKISPILNRIIHIFVGILCVLIVAVPFSGLINNPQQFQWQAEGVKVLARVLIFWILIPIIVITANRYITWDYLKMHIKSTFRGLSNLLYKVVSPIRWFINIIKKLFSPITHKVSVNLSGVKLNFQGSINKELDQKLELAGIFHKNINSILDKVSEIKNHSKMILGQFDGGNKIFSKRIELLKGSIQTINKELNIELTQIQTQLESQKENIENSVNVIAEELGKDEENLKNARLGIKQGVLEAFRELEQ